MFSKQTVVTVAEIHEEFDNSVDKIVEEAQKILSDVSLREIEELKKLRSMGFLGMGQIQDLVKKEEYEQIGEKAEYYRKQYGKKFITEAEVKRICKKYGLVIGKPRDFIGEMPPKNRAEIIDFKVKEEDGGWVKSWFSAHGGIMERKISKKEADAIRANTLTHLSCEKGGLKIVGTIDQFDLENKVISDYVIKDKDPIVLYDVEGGYLIVSKWGAEAELI